MSDIKEFLDVLNGEWAKSQNLKKFGLSFGSYDYVARVLEVTDLDGESQEEQRQSDIAAQENDKSKEIKPEFFYKAKYQIRARILSEATQNSLNEGPPDPRKNPDVFLPDPCDLDDPKSAQKIAMHPKYYPLREDLKKPHVGDIIRVQRTVDGDESQNFGIYVGFALEAPPIALPKPKKRRRPRFNYRKPRKRVTKQQTTPPVQYKGQQLAEVAAQAAEAINNYNAPKSTSSVVQQRGPSDPNRTGLAAPGFGLDPLDPRLNVEFVQSPKPPNKSIYKGIPDSWTTVGSDDFIILENFILDNAEGFPGMPNGNTRLFLNNEIRKDVVQVKDGTIKNEVVNFPPSPIKFSKQKKYWELWWNGLGSGPRRNISPKYRAIIKNGMPSQFGNIRFGFGSFEFDDIEKYFPNKEMKEYGINHTGVECIGDAACEMYALMMFIKINFGTMYQFSQMIEQTRNGKLSFGGISPKECQKELANRHKKSGPLPLTIGDYVIDYTVMSTKSQFKFGMCGPYPPEEDI
tara:strand:+ start:1448 stop:2998 length:1551 start_codon:yes stop_codon:yes gene_type:complete